MAGGVGSNYMTLWNGYTDFGDEAFISSGGSGRVRIKHNSTTTSPQLRVIEDSNADFARIMYTNNNSTSNFAMAARPGSTSPRWQVAYDGNAILTVHGDDIQDDPDNVKTGRVGINDTNPTYALELPNDATIEIGQARAQDWDTYSDARIKTDIKCLDSAIETVKDLNPVSYNHHSSTFEKGEVTINENEYRRNLGFLAQEVYEVIPEAVSKPKNENDDLWSMSYDKLIPVLTKAIQEQQVIIEDLQKELASQKILIKKWHPLINSLSKKSLVCKQGGI